MFFPPLGCLATCRRQVLAVPVIYPVVIAFSLTIELFPSFFTFFDLYPTLVVDSILFEFRVIVFASSSNIFSLL